MEIAAFETLIKERYELDAEIDALDRDVMKPKRAKLDELEQKILQTLAPQLNKKKAEYVEEAEVGDILLKGHEPSIVKGDKGFEFVPLLKLQNLFLIVHQCIFFVFEQ